MIEGTNLDINPGLSCAHLQSKSDEDTNRKIHANLLEAQINAEKIQIYSQYLQQIIQALTESKETHENQGTLPSEVEMNQMQELHDKFRTLFAEINDIETTDSRFPIPEQFADMTEQTFETARNCCEYNLTRCQNLTPHIQQKLFQVIQLAYLIADMNRKTLETHISHMSNLARNQKPR